MLAASVAADVPVGVGEILDGLDRDLMELALAAFAHAAGTHAETGLRFSHDGFSLDGGGTLYPWPEQRTAD